MVPNMVLRPRLSSIRKNSVDQKGLAGNRAITSVKAMNAKPVPSTPCMTKTAGSRIKISGVQTAPQFKPGSVVCSNIMLQ